MPSPSIPPDQYRLPPDDTPEDQARQRTLAGLPAPLALQSLFDTAPAPLDFVLPGLVAGTVGALVSMGGVGKSYWVLQAAASVAVPGYDPLGLTVADHGGVLVLATEDPGAVLHARLHALGRTQSAAQQRQLAAQFALLPAAGRSIDILNDSTFDELVALGRGRRLLVLDTLTRIHRLDENKAGDAARILGRLEALASATGAAVLYVHHISKAAALGGLSDVQQASRGSSVLVDNCRWQASMSGMSEREAREFRVTAADRAQYMRWGISKQNYAPPSADRWYARDSQGFFVPVELPTHGAPGMPAGTAAGAPPARGQPAPRRSALPKKTAPYSPRAPF